MSEAAIAKTANIADMGVDPAIITQTPGVVSGAPVFAGTRVPVCILLNYLIEGAPLAEFLDNYPEVTQDHAISVIKLAFTRTIGPDGHENFI